MEGFKGLFQNPPGGRFPSANHGADNLARELWNRFGDEHQALHIEIGRHAMRVWEYRSGRKTGATSVFRRQQADLLFPLRIRTPVGEIGTVQLPFRQELPVLVFAAPGPLPET
jgi:hypothetical protein